MDDPDTSIRIEIIVSRNVGDEKRPLQVVILNGDGTPEHFVNAFESALVASGIGLDAVKVRLA